MVLDISKNSATSLDDVQEPMSLIKVIRSTELKVKIYQQRGYGTTTGMQNSGAIFTCNRFSHRRGGTTITN